jgi:putative sterol carrier protein
MADRAQSAREFFEGAESRIDPSKTRGFRATYRFDVEGAGSWRVEVDDGTVRIEESDASADCVVHASEATFLRIVNREGSPMTAFLTGKVRVEGDMGLLLKLREFLL